MAYARPYRNLMSLYTCSSCSGKRNPSDCFILWIPSVSFMVQKCNFNIHLMCNYIVYRSSGNWNSSCLNSNYRSTMSNKSTSKFCLYRTITPNLPSNFHLQPTGLLPDGKLTNFQLLLAMMVSISLYTSKIGPR